MQVFKALTRKPSVQPSTATAEPASNVHHRPPPPATTTTAAPTPASRLSHVSSIPPSPGMLGILVTDGVQMTIEYLREVPYNGPLPTRSPVIVQPVPKFRVGTQLPLFIDGRHFIAKIIAIAPHVHIGAGEPPRIGTQIFDFPTSAVGTPCFDVSLPMPPENGLGLEAIPELCLTTPTMSPTPLSREAATLPQRTRAMTLSTAAINISQSDQEAFQRVQDGFLATGPALSTPKVTPLTEEQLPNPPRPQASNRRPSDASASVNRPPAQAAKRTPMESPSPGASVAPRMGRMRTTSAAAVPTSMEEKRTQMTSGRHNLRPSGSAIPMAVPSTTTPGPRRRLRSDAAAHPPHTPRTVILWQAIEASGLLPDDQPSNNPRNPPIKPKGPPPKSGLFSFGAGKLWPKPGGVNFPKRGGEPPSGVTVEKTVVQTTTLGFDQTPSLPMPSGLNHAGNSQSAEPQERREVSWISLDWTTAHLKDSPEAYHDDVDPLATECEPRPRKRLPSRQASVTSSPNGNKGKGREEAPTSGGIVRVTLDGSTGSSHAPTVSTLSRAESRRYSARKELPPIPPHSAILLSPQSFVRSQIQEEKEERVKGTTLKSLSAVLDLTPPPSPARRGGSVSNSGTPRTANNWYVPRTPDSNVVSYHHRSQYLGESPPNSHASTSLSIITPVITPDARVTTCQIKPMVWERGQIYAAPAPLDQTRTHLPAGSMQSLTTQTDHTSNALLASSSNSSTTLGDRYKTAPSTAYSPSTDSGCSWNLSTGAVDSKDLPRAVEVSEGLRARMASTYERGRNAAAVRPPIDKF